MSKSSKNQAAAKPVKAPKAKPTLNAKSLELLKVMEAMLDKGEIDLAQVRLIEKEVAARKSAMAKAKGPSAGADAKAKSLAKHAVLMRNVATWLKSGDVEKVKAEGAVLTKTALQELMKNASVKNRSKIKDKAEMIAALIATAPSAMKQAA